MKKLLFPFLKAGNASRRLTIVTLVFMVCCGLFFVLVQARPFWIDEWRVIYNLKYKSPGKLWGELAYMQQFPRVYLQLIKAFAAPFDYSYFTLRLPSFIVGTFAMYLAYRLMKRIFPEGRQNKYLFLLIIFSCFTATEYYVQVKQYTMDILTSLIAIWQVMEVYRLLRGGASRWKRYLLFCISLMIVPFFSYTYPIAIAPLFIMAPIQLIINRPNFNTRRIAMLVAVLVCSTAGIIGFYFVDVQQVIADKGMHMFWNFTFMNDGFDIKKFTWMAYLLFAYAGSGYVFEIITATFGIAGFVYGAYRIVTKPRALLQTRTGWLLAYAVVLILLTFGLYLAHKLPIENRLNVFIIPSLAILIISFLNYLEVAYPKRKAARYLAVLLMAGTAGNIYTTYLTQLFQLPSNRALDIYVATENAIIQAEQQHLPIMITPYIAYPHQGTANLPDWRPIPGDWVLKSFPAYKVDEGVDVYAIENAEQAGEALCKLPDNIKSAIAGDGMSYYVVNR